MDYDIHFNKIGDNEEWKKYLESAADKDDDEELDETPPEIVSMLGFDPRNDPEFRKHLKK